VLSKGPQNRKGLGFRERMRNVDPRKMLGLSRRGRLTFLTVAAVIVVPIGMLCGSVIAFPKGMPYGAATSRNSPAQRTAGTKSPSLRKLLEKPNVLNQVTGPNFAKGHSAEPSRSQREMGLAKMDKRSLFAKDPNFIGGPPQDINMSGLFYKMLFLVGVVVALGGAATYVSKKYGSRFNGFSGDRVQILERTHIAPRKMIFLLKVGNQKFLVGSTREHLTMLAEITGSLDETDLQHGEASLAGAQQHNENTAFKDSLEFPVTPFREKMRNENPQ